MNGKFITLEGIEGTGKSTQLTKIANYLTSKEIESYTTQEPGGSQFGEKIRHWLLQPDYPISKTTELLLFYAARIEHIEQQIKPALQRGCWVICDRFIDSSYAYQGGGCNIPLQYIEQLNHMAVPMMPDLTILLDMDPNYIWERINTATLDRFESEDKAFFARVRNAYLQCAHNDPNRIKVINAEQNIAQVTQLIIEQLERLIK